MQQTGCPSADELRAFAIGNLPQAAVARISDHLGACRVCEASLAQWDELEDVLVSGLRRLPPGGRDAEVPSSLMSLATSVYRNRDQPAADVSPDPARRLANRLAAGPCRLGRYWLEAELGVGSFGYVFRARDTELDRTVALKVQRAGCFASEEEAERFLREARSVAHLKHPGIVAIYDTGQTEDGVCYLVTEFVEGETLADRLERGGQPPREAARLIADVCDALASAHAGGVFHRDVKPSNILIDESDRPHLADFGLAKRDAGETMTSEGRVIGTPAYMSPEQARGESREVDARSDIYSLGVILYELVTGERPFHGNRRLLLLQVLEDEPRPPRQIKPDVPRDLETICLKAMAKSPSRRYPSAAEMAQDLRRFLNNEPIKARPVGYPERLWRWCARYPFAVMLLVAVVFGSFAGFWYLSSLSTHYVHATALESTRMEADMLEKINQYYSEEVVGRLDWDKIKVTHQYAKIPQSVPLPFTFMIDAGERITESQEGVQVRIYSNDPWREDGGPKNDFERRALDLLTERASESGDRSFHEFSNDGGRPVLNYARAQIMAQSCVKCHNEHLQSPRRDWREGDVAGVLAITRPLDRDIERTRSGLRGAFNVMGLIALGLAGLSLAVLLTTHRRSRAGE